ncbi:MAG TPA: AraC family transcriptional regulator [Caulobacteraceae bacterium]|nr:AraC family transcriptional regulator [Caulobacteraceae bacterium]
MVAYVRAGALTNFAEVAREFGLDPAALARAAGLDPRVLSEPGARVPTAKVASLLERSAKEAGCPTFALRMARTRRLADLGAVGLMIAHQPTLGDALATTIRYRNLVNESLAMSLEEDGDLAILRAELLVEPGVAMRQTDELAIGTLFRLFRAVLGARWQPYSVNFAHLAPPDSSFHRSVFGERVEFGCEFNGVVFAAADLNRPNPAADPALAEHARSFVDTLPKAQMESMTGEVAKAVYLLLPIGGASISQVAQWLGINVRTLQRRLSAESEAFSDVVARIRRELATRYLANPAHSLAEIARMLDFAQHSSFTRWFTAEFGMPPAQWRLEARSRAVAARGRRRRRS